MRGGGRRLGGEGMRRTIYSMAGPQVTIHFYKQARGGKVADEPAKPARTPGDEKSGGCGG